MDTPIYFIILTKIPINIEEVRQEGLDRAILRFGIIIELDVINLHEQIFFMI